MQSFLFSAILCLVILSCKPESAQPSRNENQSYFKYANHLKIEEKDDSLLIYSGGNRITFSKENLPLKDVMVVPTAAIAYLNEIGETERITGISQPDFIYNPKVQTRLKENKIMEIGTFNELFIEKILMSKPDVFISTSGSTLAKFHELLKKEGIKILYIDEYEELEPLAKAEYIRVFGKLFGKEQKADSIFKQIEKNYRRIQTTILEKSEKRPSVLLNQIYGDVWYMPGGKSFQANLIRDAGGNYLWESDSGTGSLNLSFETVFEKASHADFWINAGDYPSRDVLMARYPQYEWFSAFRNSRVYNWNKRKSATGANDYFETGTARPDWVLKDLAAIFHPELFPGHELYFYERLK